MKSHASVLYVKAVERLKIELMDGNETSSSPSLATIWSAVFLGIYEMVSSDSTSNWLKHSHGVAAMTYMAGPYGFQTNASKPIFQVNRSFISIGAMADRKRTFLEQDAWKLVPWVLEPMSKTISESLQDVLCDVPGLMEDVDTLTKYQYSGLLAGQITSKLQSCFNELETLRISWNYIYADSCWEVQGLSSLEPEMDEDRRSSFESALIFSNLEQAVEFVYFNTTHLLLHSILRQLRSANNAEAFNMDLFSFLSPDDQDHCILTFRNHKERHHNALLAGRGLFHTDFLILPSISNMRFQNISFFFAAYTAAAGHVQWAGVNLFGLANDINILGSAYNTFLSLSCEPSYNSYPYIDTVENYESWHEKGFNLFRIAMAWQHVQVSLGGHLNETNMKAVDRIVKKVTDDGGQAILDIHNYARWYCAVIGQPEVSFLNPNITVTNDHFANLWTRLAERYKDNPNVIFQLMNEPHDLDITKWGATNQAAILAIRNITTEQKILVSGTQYARLVDWEAFSAPGIGPGLIQDPANNTLYDFHQYFDDIGGAYGLCEPWSGFVKRFEAVTSILRSNNLQGMITEFGGGPFPQCAVTIRSLLAFLERNSDVWYGWTAWGSFNEGSDLYLGLDKNSTFNLITRTLEEFVP
ncbi:cellulase (glycosyl hydrolase family 5) domain-containing protein [Fusarium heterosporum]|uniref:cellulase n=1 Tax=Fusarium heterosporum TaxID=42747 RepID=A0A8H5WLD3_FUSHE|nr:cellulase (glycosyl hydrolase family 5) domain-containing protein [Fusarium heterosporum]